MVVESLPLGIFKTRLNKPLKNFEVSPALRRRLEQMASRGHFHSELFDDSVRKGHAHCFTLLQEENSLC